MKKGFISKKVCLMNRKTLFIGITIYLSGFNLLAQQEFTQFKLSKHNLVGKTDQELRIMRNEIFAAHDYIFNSEDLARHFDKEPWYTPLYLNVDDKLTDIDKYNISLISDFERKADVERILIDSAYTIMLHAKQVNDLNYQRTIEVTYPGYEWKKTVDKASFGAEKEPTIVKMEFLHDSPYNSDNKPYWQLRKPVDEMKLEYNYIHAIEYMFPEGYSELYAFFKNEPFLKFTGNNFYKVRLPNTGMEALFIGLENIDGSDKEVIGRIYLGTVKKGIQNILTLKSKNFKNYIPEDGFTLSSSNSRDKVNWKKELELNSSANAKDRSEITTFYINVYYGKDHKIPVEKGYINGSEELQQTLYLE